MKIFRSRSHNAGKAVETLIKKCGVDPEFMYGKLSDSDILPHEQFSIQKING